MSNTPSTDVTPAGDDATVTPGESAYVLVIGSASVDVSVMSAKLPEPGETVIGHGSLIAPGGKGSNQAVAAAACGAPTRFVGRTGADDFGRMIRAGLAARGVGIEALQPLAGIASGLATISVEDSGRNAIVVVPGANSRLLPADLEALEGVLRGAAIVVLQCEIPMETVHRAIELAASAAIPVILNPAPYRELASSRIARDVSYLVPNETEAGQMLERPIRGARDAEQGALALLARGYRCVIVTLGADGCVVAADGATRHYPGHAVTAVDTTGAGDAFVGALAAALAGGATRDTAVRRALLYSALSVTRSGAQVSYPLSEEFERAWSASR
jgi:ribokinase